MAFRDYEESKNVKIPEEQEKIMDIMCEAWEQCLNRCDCIDNCPDRAGQTMRLAMCMALKQSRLLTEAGYAPVVRCGEWHFVSNKPCCSICGKPTMEIPPKKYCPHCGAKMDGGNIK